MTNGFLPAKYDKPLRVLGIDLGTTNSVMTEINWQPGSTPETKVIQIEQDTPLGAYTDILFPSVIAIQAGKVWVGEGANRMNIRWLCLSRHAQLHIRNIRYTL
jgi:molecular chaperone DnaK (HSP70)